MRGEAELKCAVKGCRGRGPKWEVIFRNSSRLGPPSTSKVILCERHFLAELILYPRRITRVEAV